MKRAVLYARVSGDDRKYATSGIESQLDDCRKYAAAQGYDVVGEFFEEPDKHTSGVDWLPELDRIIKLAPSGTFDVLVVREIDRLARNRFKQMSVEIELENHGVVVEYVLGQFEHSPEGRLLKGLMSEFAEYEREKTRQRTQRGKLLSVNAGNVTVGGSVAPYGYDPGVVNARRTLVINEQEAAIVRMIFDLYAIRLYSLGEIRDYLDEHKVSKPAKGNNHHKLTRLAAWSEATINGFLDNETYIGHWFFRKTRTVKDAATGKQRNLPRPRDEWMEIAVPPIVSEELFAAAQHRKDVNKVQMGRQRKNEYALGGMVTCGHCGNSVSGGTKVVKGYRYQYLMCNARHMPKKYGFRCDNPPYKVEQVDAAVWGWIKSLLLEPDVLRKSLEDYQQQQRDRIQPQLAMMESSQARIGGLEAQKTRLIAAYSAGVLELDELATQKTALDKEIGELTQAVSALRAEAEPQLLSAERIDAIETIAAQIRAGASAADGDKQAQRAIFQLLDVHVVLSYDGQKRWADATCTLGNARYAVEYNSRYDILSPKF